MSEEIKEENPVDPIELSIFKEHIENNFLNILDSLPKQEKRLVYEESCLSKLLFFTTREKLISKKIKKDFVMLKSGILMAECSIIIYIIPPKKECLQIIDNHIEGNNKKINNNEEDARKQMEYHIIFFPKINLECQNYIDKSYNYHIPIDSKKMTKLIRKEYKLKIRPMTDLSFTLRPNRVYELPVKILNLSDSEINSSQFMIVVKNNKLINISYEIDKIFDIKPNEEYELKLICRTPNNNTLEQINIEIYSDQLKIRMSSRLNFDIEIEINKDDNDDKLNAELNNDKYAIFHSKMHKKVILSMIYFNSEWKNDLKNVCQVLRDNNWDINKSIHFLNKQK